MIHIFRASERKGHKIMDSFHECLVTRRSSGADIAKNIGIGLLCLVLSAAVVLFLPSWAFPFHIVFVIGIFYGGFYLMSGIGVEYEYILTNDEIDIDKIMGKRKRKRLITVGIKTFENFGKIADAPAVGSDYTIVQASDNSGEGEYFCDLKHNTLGNVRVIFTPDEKIVEGIELFLPGPVKADYRRFLRL